MSLASLNHAQHMLFHGYRCVVDRGTGCRAAPYLSGSSCGCSRWNRGGIFSQFWGRGTVPDCWDAWHVPLAGVLVWHRRLQSSGHCSLPGGLCASSPVATMPFSATLGIRVWKAVWLPMLFVHFIYHRQRSQSSPFDLLLAMLFPPPFDMSNSYYRVNYTRNQMTLQDKDNKAALTHNEHQTDIEPTLSVLL